MTASKLNYLIFCTRIKHDEGPTYFVSILFNLSLLWGRGGGGGGGVVGFLVILQKKIFYYLFIIASFLTLDETLQCRQAGRIVFKK